MTVSPSWGRLVTSIRQAHRTLGTSPRAFDTRSWIGWATLSVAWVCFAAIGRGQTLHTVGDVRFDAAAVSISAEGFRFSDAQGTLLSQSSLDEPAVANRLLRWGSWGGVRARSAIWIANGSWLCGNIELVGESMRVAGKWLEPIEIPLSQIRGVVFQPPASTRDWLEMSAAMQSANGTADRVWLENGSGIAGVVQLRESPDGIEFEVKSKTSSVNLNRDEVRYLIFSPALLGPIDKENEVLEVGISDGSLLRCTGLDSEGGHLKFEIGAGLAAQSIDSPARISRELRFLHDGRVEVNDLSSMKVAQYRHVAGGSTLKWNLGINSDVNGRPLLTSSGSYRGMVRSGLAMHASSQAAFRWDQAPGRLLAELEFAMPPSGANPDLGSVRCKVLGAKNGKLVTLYDERLCRNSRSDPSRRIVDVDVSGTQLIVLVVEEDDQGALGDHVHWLDARIVAE